MTKWNNRIRHKWHPNGLFQYQVTTAGAGGGCDKDIRG
jgi:hypothetical protein